MIETELQADCLLRGVLVGKELVAVDVAGISQAELLGLIPDRIAPELVVVSSDNCLNLLPSVGFIEVVRVREVFDDYVNGNLEPDETGYHVEFHCVTGSSMIEHICSLTERPNARLVTGQERYIVKGNFVVCFFLVLLDGSRVVVTSPTDAVSGNY